MHIKKIELENIKSHAGSTFEFARGTTAITGENGAGKTTLIEAVAWTLFDLLDYRKDDFVSRGAKKGVARVTFESGLDEREYTVYRDTGTGYYVYDPALKTRIADKKDEVCRFLWQHLGVEAGTDLDALFRRAIGVPQGTFTAIFLESPAERKKAFDKLLKVEEYRRGADELLKTSRYIDGQISAVAMKIARAEGELGRLEIVEEEQKNVAEQAETLGSYLENVAKLAAEKQDAVCVLDEKESKLNNAKTVRDSLASEGSRAELVLKHKETELEQSRRAAASIDAVRADAAKHKESLGRIKELERERGERDKIRMELSKVESAIATVKTDQKHASVQLENALEAHRAIQALTSSVAEQERCEKEVETLRNRLANARAVVNQVKNLDEKIGRLRDSYRTNQTQLTEAKAKTNGAVNIEDLQSRDAEIVRELARLQANLERDERFQNEIKNGLCPILSQKCLNLKEGETLDGFISSQFSEIRAQISTLQAEHSQVSVALKHSREAEKYSAQVAALQTREEELREEGSRLKSEKESLEQTAADLAGIEGELAAAEAMLEALDNPKAKTRILAAEMSREAALRENIAEIERNLERLESDRQILVEQLELYKDLDPVWTEACEVRDRTEEAHRTFLANESLAGLAGKRAGEFEAAGKELAETQEKLAAAEKEFETAGSDYNRDLHLTEKAALIELQQRQAETRARLEAAKRREAELSTELERLAETRKAMHVELREKERLEKVSEATTFIRDTLKEAAPLVARNYVYHVSLEANHMFREITGNAERTLKWTEDYGIVLEEGGFERPFVSLSGGEQMAAALSVRLALLKQLTDIRIAFFDEPTTNMDAERRENLAQQISRIGHFDQLFVISHDDTFEGYTDHVVTVERP